MPTSLSFYLILIVGIVGYIGCWSFFLKVVSARLPLSIMAICGVVFPPVGSVVGLWYMLAGPRVSVSPKILFRSDDILGLVDYIDRNANASLIAVNSQWLRQNWHNMTEDQKVEWVRARFRWIEQLLPGANSAPEFIEALMTADKSFRRSSNI